MRDGDQVVALALTERELRLVIRGVRAVISEEGWSTAAVSVDEMLQQPLGRDELQTLRESE